MSFALGPLAIIAVIVILAIGVVALREMRRMAHRPGEGEDLTPDSRSLLLPIRRLVSEIEEIVASQKASPMTQAIGKEAVAEARRLRDQIGHSLNARSEIQRALRLQSSGEAEAAQLEMQIERSMDLNERSALESALAARRAELSHFGELRDNMARIDLSVRQAEALLSELRTRLRVSVTAEKAGTGEDLREAISRMRSISLSVDEVDKFMNG